jgi:hypothetical protein
MSKGDRTVEGVPLYGVTGLDGTKSHTMQVSWAANGALTGVYLSVYGFMFVLFEDRQYWTLLTRSCSIYDNSPGQPITTAINAPAVIHTDTTFVTSTTPSTVTAAPGPTNLPANTVGDTNTPTAVTTSTTFPPGTSLNNASSPTRNALVPDSAPTTFPALSNSGMYSPTASLAPHIGSTSVVISKDQAQTQGLFTSGSSTLRQMVTVGTTVVNGQTQTQTATMLAGGAGASGQAGTAGAPGSNGKGVASNTVLIGGVVGGVVGGALAAMLLTLLILYLRRQRRQRLLVMRKRDHGKHGPAQPEAVALTVLTEYHPGPETAERSQAYLVERHASSLGTTASTGARAFPRRDSPSLSDASTDVESFWLTPLSPPSAGDRPIAVPATPVRRALTLGAIVSDFAFTNTNPEDPSGVAGSTTGVGPLLDSRVSDPAPPLPAVLPTSKLHAVARARVFANQAVGPGMSTLDTRHSQLAPVRAMSMSLSVADEVPPPMYSER